MMMPFRDTYEDQNTHFLPQDFIFSKFNFLFNPYISIL